MALDIDYIGVLHYLDENRDKPYSDPDKDGLDPQKREEYIALRKKGQFAVSEIKKMAKVCENEFGLNKCMPVQWLDGSGTKTKRYLWAQLKYDECSDIPISISIFVEHNGERGTEFRVSLEIKNDGVDDKTMSRYHSYLDIPIDKSQGLVFVTGSNKWGRPEILNKSQEDIKKLVNTGELRKVQLSKYLPNTNETDNKYYHEALLEAVKQLLPYYDHVIGRRGSTDIQSDYWPSFEEYPVNLNKDDWKEFIYDVESQGHNGCMRVLKCFIDVGGEASPKVLSEKYKGNPTIYTSSVKNTCQRALKYFDMQPCPDGPHRRIFPIGFWGKNGTDAESGNYVYKMRPELMEALQEMDLSSIDLEYGKSYKVAEFDKNIILYGPPGTGKTYITAKYAVAICKGCSIDELTDYDDVMTEFNRLKEERRVAFTTFHQSYGYEEFIEGIKPSTSDGKITYNVESGIFKEFCLKAGRKRVSSSEDLPDMNNARVWCLMLDGTGDTELKRKCFEENTIRTGWSEQPAVVTNDTPGVTDQTRKMIINFQEELSIGDIVVIEHDTKSIDGIAVVTGDYEYDGSANWARKRTVKWLLKNKVIDITALNGGKGLGHSTFHPLDRINPEQMLKFVDEDFTFENETKPYVFIIDEINRGNISKIFGELITLIEGTKRAGADEAASAILPYSKVPFSIPNNVYIVGTMNTADRSIALMDTALRRRFKFVEMMPDSEVLTNLGISTIESNGVTLDVVKMLDCINERITFLYDREHTIGHAFFTGLKDNPSIEALGDIFKKSVVPLLQEYFYEDYEKIQLVLGDNAKIDETHKFIKNIPVQVNTVFKGTVNEDIDIPDTKYEINESAFYNISSYVEIM